MGCRPSALRWSRPTVRLLVDDGGAGGGGGRSRIIEQVRCWRRVVSASPMSMATACRPSATAHRPELAGRSFQAMGGPW